jgi:hypothetical protein
MIPGLPFTALPLLFFAEGFFVVIALGRWVFPGAQATLAIWGIGIVWLGVGVGILTFTVQCMSLKRKLIAPHRTNTAMVPTKPENHPGLAVAELEAQTAQLQALGFEPIIDYTLRNNPPTPYDGFARILYQNDNHVFAESNQVLVRAIAATPMATSLSTLFVDGWSFATYTRPPSRNTAIIYALRRPKRLWQIIPDAPLSIALDSHVKTAQALLVKRRLTPVSGDPAEAYLSSLEKQRTEQYDVNRKRNLFMFLWDVDRYNASPKLEWLGE